MMANYPFYLHNLFLLMLFNNNPAIAETSYADFGSGEKIIIVEKNLVWL